MPAPTDHALPLPHDAAYKAMYRHRQAILDLRPFLLAPNGPLAPDTLAALDFSSLARLPADWVTARFRRRHGDQLWRIPFRDAEAGADAGACGPSRAGSPRSQGRHAPASSVRGAATARRPKPAAHAHHDAGAGAWLLLLLEFQSRHDPDMALRVLGYVLELYRDLEARGVVRPGSPRPPVLPVVIHNGEAPWRAPVAVAEMIALPPVPAAVRRDLASLQPAQRLHVVDFPTHRQDDLVPGNVVSLQIGFEYAQPEDYARLLPAVAELKDAGLRRTVWEWVALRARRQGMTLEEVDVEGTYFRSRIGDNFKRATQAWFAEGVEEGLRRGREQGLEQGREQGLEQGREQGIEQGIERGLEQQRALLMRQVAAKFGADAPARVGPLLSRVADAASLAEVGEAVLVAATETELAARVEAVIAPAHRIGEPDDAPARDRHPRC